MKIKLHNSLGKINNPDYFLFDDKIFIYMNLKYKMLFINHNIEDSAFFLRFYIKTKNFDKAIGFGNVTNNSRLTRWWKKIKWENIA